MDWEEGPPGKLSNKNLWGYAFGAVPGVLLGFIFALKYVEFFYNDLRLLPIYFIIGQVIYMTINALNDPLSGQLSDRTNSEKWGSRRIIYIKYGGPIWAATFLLVWFPWSLDDQFIIFLHYVISICLFDTLLTLVVLVWLATLPEMTPDLDQRNKAHFVSIVLGTITFVVAFIIIFPMTPNSDVFRISMGVIAVISTIFLFLVARMCEEKPEFRKDERFSLGKSLKETFKSKAFIRYVPYNFASGLLGNLALSYVFIYVLLLDRVSPGAAVAYYFLIYILVGFGANIFCMWLRPKWGMRKIILVFGTSRVIGVLILFIIILDPALEWFIWIGFLWTTFFGGYGIFQMPMNFLAIDEDEVKHGVRREGMFLGINALLTKPAASLGPIIATLILVYFGYIQGAPGADQPESAFLGIKILMFLVPAIVVALSLIPIYFYPLHGEHLKEMKEKLKEIHDIKRKKWLESINK